MAVPLDQMNTLQKLQLMANLVANIKQTAPEEFAGTDVVPTLDGLMDELGGVLGEALKAVEANGEAVNNPQDVAPEPPSEPAAPMG